MSQSKDNAGLLHCGLDPKTMFDRRGHRLLAQNIVSLSGEGHDQFHVHMVLDGDENGICKALSDCLDGFRGSFVELLPSFEHEIAVDAVSICEERPCLRPWLRNCYHLAFRGL